MYSYSNFKPPVSDRNSLALPFVRSLHLHLQRLIFRQRVLRITPSSHGYDQLLERTLVLVDAGRGDGVALLLDVLRRRDLLITPPPSPHREP